MMTQAKMHIWLNVQFDLCKNAFTQNDSSQNLEFSKYVKISLSKNKHFLNVQNCGFQIV